jgi:type II secretory pathway pseudopilin PulG
MSQLAPRQRGLTTIEFLVACSIIGILSAPLLTTLQVDGRKELEVELE